MSDSDPFSAFETDRTVIKPSAGRGTRPIVNPTVAAPQPETAPLPELVGGAGLGLVLQLASPLLIAAARIRAMPQHANPQALRSSLVDAVGKFERDARARGMPNDQVVASRYILCTYIDECASNTPWGGSGAWSAQSLLVQFHNEAWGGEKVFQLMGKLAENAATNRSLLELIYCVLSLGFEGRYRVIQNGRLQLDSVREKLALKLREEAGSAMGELSPKWRGVAVAGQGLRDGLSIWVVAIAVSLILALTFAVLRFSISDKTDRVFSELQALGMKVPSVPVPVFPVSPAPSVVPRLSGLLKPEIDAGLIEVRDLADRSIVTIRGDGFFEPGSAEVGPRVLPLLRRIAEELARIEGQILVTGHTDNQPIRSLRFPSNWHLSEERAKSVKSKLALTLKPERIHSEGLADTQPIADNSTPLGRAKNRRVEVTLRLN